MEQKTKIRVALSKTYISCFQFSAPYQISSDGEWTKMERGKSSAYHDIMSCDVNYFKQGGVPLLYNTAGNPVVCFHSHLQETWILTGTCSLLYATNINSVHHYKLSGSFHPDQGKKDLLLHLSSHLVYANTEEKYVIKNML